MSIWSIIITISSALLGLPGFCICSLVLLVRLADLQSAGYPYLFPIGSVKAYKFKDILFRGPLKDISGNIVDRGQ